MTTGSFNEPDVEQKAVSRARELMEAFGRDTGIVSARPPRRYLWTDAFAVCNYIGLHRSTDEDRFLELARSLVEQVHRVLGRHRTEDPREGWISGLSEAEGAQHPTAGGLRIGKPLPERRPGEPYDRQLEWERDGQYFHYLTRWMHALNRVWDATGNPEYHRWAVELAQAAIRGFSRSAGGERRLQWKMSVNLSRSLVPSMGQHDPLDGYLNVAALRASAPDGPTSVLGLELHALREMVERDRGSWATSDSLGAGGLLVDAHRSLQLRARGSEDLLDGLPGELLDESLRSVAAVAGSGFRVRSAESRLAFRELGLSIGLGTVERMKRLVLPPARPAGRSEEPGKDPGSGHERGEERGSGDRGRGRDGEDEGRGGDGGNPRAHGVSSIDEPRIRALERYVTLRDEIHRFWLDPRSREAETWTGHEDISRVMLATSLAPAGYLEI